MLLLLYWTVSRKLCKLIIWYIIVIVLQMRDNFCTNCHRIKVKMRRPIDWMKRPRMLDIDDDIVEDEDDDTNKIWLNEDETDPPFDNDDESDN
jgi:hypothetical protein